jgi:hypothetical protein
MRYGDFIEGPGLTNGVFPDVYMAHHFGTRGVGPINGPTIVIVDGDGSVWVKEAEVGEDMAKHLHIFDTFMGGLDLCFTRAPADSALFVHLP